MTRWIVLFLSHHEPPVDSTAADVRARSMLEAIKKAKREAPPHHEWAVVYAYPWPMGAADVGEASAQLARSRR